MKKLRQIIRVVPLSQNFIKFVLHFLHTIISPIEMRGYSNHYKENDYSRYPHNYLLITVLAKTRVIKNIPIIQPENRVCNWEGSRSGPKDNHTIPRNSKVSPINAQTFKDLLIIKHYNLIPISASNL